MLITFEQELFKDWLVVNGHTASSTAHAYQSIIYNFLAENHDFKDIESIREFLQGRTLKEGKRFPQAINAIIKFLEYKKSEDELSKSEYSDMVDILKSMRVSVSRRGKKNIPKHVPKEARIDVYNALYSINKKHAILYLIQFLTGCRSNDIMRLKLIEYDKMYPVIKSPIYWERNENHEWVLIIDVRGKGNKVNRCPILNFEYAKFIADEINKLHNFKVPYKTNFEEGEAPYQLIRDSPNIEDVKKDAFIRKAQEETMINACKEGYWFDDKGKLNPLTSFKLIDNYYFFEEAENSQANEKDPWIIYRRHYNRYLQDIKKAAVMCGVSHKIATHDLRRGVAVDVIRNGAQAYQLQKLLNHSRINTTLGYFEHDDNNGTNELLRKIQGVE